MKRRLFLAGAMALGLSACGGDLLGPPEASPIYPLRPTFPAAAGGEKVSWALSILRPDVPGGLDNDRIALLQVNGTLDYYANATYPDQLSDILQRAMVEGFEASGRVAAVAREQDALQSDYVLLLSVKDFQTLYTVQDGIPEAQVTMDAKLATARGRRVLATLRVSKTATASVNSTAAATQALSQALGQAVSDVVAWTLTAAPAIVPGQSGETASPGRPGEQLLRDVTRGSENARESVTPRP